MRNIHTLDHKCFVTLNTKYNLISYVWEPQQCKNSLTFNIRHLYSDTEIELVVIPCPQNHLQKLIWKVKRSYFGLPTHSFSSFFIGYDQKAFYISVDTDSCLYPQFSYWKFILADTETEEFFSIRQTDIWPIWPIFGQWQIMNMFRLYPTFCTHCRNTNTVTLTSLLSSWVLFNSDEKQGSWQVLGLQSFMKSRLFGSHSQALVSSWVLFNFDEK